MDNVWQFLGLCLGLELVDICSGYPLNHSTLAGGAVVWSSLSPLLSVALLLCSVLLVFGCLCCRRTKGFQEFTDSGSTPNLSSPTGGYVNNAASTEFPLFPPPQPANQSVRFEPLPEIVPPNRSKKPAAFNNAVSHGLSEQDWFAGGPGVDFPRQQLTYVREAGRGWFGRVVEGNAQHIVHNAATTPVVVKILRDDASPTDQMFFLHEVRAYRDLRHPNVLRMMGRCLEADPFLVLLEACPTGDLKSFLCQNISTARALSEDGVTLNMACNIAAGLEHMLDHGFVHTDLAARNCLVTPDLTVKIGDYGHSIESFKEDYYIAGDVALPVRWCAPETVYCTDTIIQTKEVTPAANVWSLGVVLWEVSEFGKLPYSELTDDEVVCQVFGESNKRLPLPSLPAPHRDNLYLLMKLCWSEVEVRPALKQVHSMLQHLNASRQRHQLDGQDSSLCTEEDFNRRWETFKPNTIPKRDDHTTEPESPPVPFSDHQAALRSPLHLALDNHSGQLASQNLPHGTHDGFDRITPSTTSPQLSLASSYGGEFFSNSLQSKDRSASLQNLRGSFEDINDNSGHWDEGKRKHRKSEDMGVETDHMKRRASEGSEKVGEDTARSGAEPDFDSWLKGVETTDEEEAKFVAKISEAIRDLDDALALEKTSSSSSEASSKQQTPVKEFRPSEQNVVLDFRLGRVAPREREESSEDSLRNSNSSDTEEETWRRRIERGEFSEKVKEKSKSVADLMVLTHIDPSDGSDSEPPSLTWSFERGPVRTSFTRNSNNNSFSKSKRESNRNTSLVSNSFGSEGDIHRAVLGEEFLESLQKIQLAKRDGNRNVLSEVANFLEREKMYQESIMPLLQVGIDFLPTNHNRESNFLGFEASGQPNVDESQTVSPDSLLSEESVSDSEQSTPRCHIEQVKKTADLLFSQEPILNMGDPVLSKENDAGKVASESAVKSAAVDDTNFNVSSASEIVDGKDNSPNEKTEIAFKSQVPQSQIGENVAESMGKDSNNIMGITDSKLNTVQSTAPHVKTVNEGTANGIESIHEVECTAAIPEIVIDVSCVDVDETPTIEIVARKPVPLPRRSLRITCKDPCVDPDGKSAGIIEGPTEICREDFDPVPEECPTFYTSTPYAPKVAPRTAATSKVLLCNVSEITADCDADDSTTLSNCSGLSWDDTVQNLPNKLDEKPNLIEKSLDSECIRSDKNILGTIENQQDLAIVQHPKQSTLQETSNSDANNISVSLQPLNFSLPTEANPKDDLLPVTVGQTHSPNSISREGRETDENKQHDEAGSESCLLGKPEPVRLDQSSDTITKQYSPTAFSPSEKSTIHSEKIIGEQEVVEVPNSLEISLSAELSKGKMISSPSSPEHNDAAIQIKVRNEKMDALAMISSEALPTTCSHNDEEFEVLPATNASSPSHISMSVQDCKKDRLDSDGRLLTTLSCGEELVFDSVDKGSLSQSQEEHCFVNENADTELSQRLSDISKVEVPSVLVSQQDGSVCQDECRPHLSNEGVSLPCSEEVEMPCDQGRFPDVPLNQCGVHRAEQQGIELKVTPSSLEDSLLVISSSDVVTKHPPISDTRCRSEMTREESSSVLPTISPQLSTSLVLTQDDMRCQESCMNREVATDPCSLMEFITPTTLTNVEKGPFASVDSESLSDPSSCVRGDDRQSEKDSDVSVSLAECTPMPVKVVPIESLGNVSNDQSASVEVFSNNAVNGFPEHGVLDSSKCKDPVVEELSAESKPGTLLAVTRHLDPCDIHTSDEHKAVETHSGKAVPATVAIAHETPTHLDKCDHKSNLSTNSDLNINQSLPKEEAVVEHFYVNSQESRSVMNDAKLNAADPSESIKNVTFGLDDRKQSNKEFLVNECADFVSDIPATGEFMSLSVCGGKDQSQDVLSSVILGPCEDFTLEYFKGLKTTFPDSSSGHETHARVHELSDDDKSSFVLDKLEDSNMDYSINGWDEFLGKTLETQDFSQYEDVTFPSLVIESGPSQTARNIDNIFESITSLQSEVPVVQSPSVVNVDTSTSLANDFDEMSVKVEREKSDVDKLKSVGDRSPWATESANEVPHEASRTDATEDCPRGSSEDRTGPGGFSPPDFHVSVEACDGLRETDEENDEFTEFALDVKHCTPDDERSSDSGFRDKGSLSESCEDACDEKYNLEDIEAELEETFNQGGFNYKLDDDESEAFQVQDRFSSPEPPVEMMNSFKGVENFHVNLDFKNASSMPGIEKTPADHLESNSSQVLPSSFSIPLDLHSTSLFKPHTMDEYLESSQVVNYVRENRILADDISSPRCNELDNESSLKANKDLRCRDLNRESCAESVSVFDSSASDESCLEETNVTDDAKGEQLSEKTLSGKRGGGWYLHPPDGSQGEVSEDFLSPKSESSNSSRHDDSENSYVSYHLDEEYVTAIRNELREKLPGANQSLDSDSEEDIVDEEEGGENRQDILIHYNMYPAPLSPILEERESMSSLDYSHINSLNFDSDPESLVFSLDSQDDAKKEQESRKFEEDIREALENVSYESSTSSSDRDPNTTVLLEDLDANAKQKVVKIRGTSTEVEDDVLVVDTETNEVSLVESAIPKLQLAFVNKRAIDQPAIVRTPDFLRDEETLAVDPGTFVISKSRFDDLEGSMDTSPSSSAPDHALHSDVNNTPSRNVEELPVQNGDVLNIDLQQTNGMLSADNCTPDSVSPTTGSDRTIPSTDMEDISDFYLTPPSDSSPARCLPYPTPTFHQPEIKRAAVPDQERSSEPTFEVVQDISLNFANNEAAEIISDLQDCGILANTKATSNENIVHLMTSEIYEYQDSTESSDEKYSPRSLEDDFEEMISFEEYSQSSESREYNAPTPESQMSLEFARSKPDFGGDMSPVQRLDFLTTSIGIMSESNEDCFDDELERTLKLNDLGNILKMNSNSSQECKSLPSPNINPSANEIIVNFVKSNKQHLELLSNHPEENLKLKRLEELNNECNSNESSNKVRSSHIDSACESVTKTNQMNELSRESSVSVCNLESGQASSSPVCHGVLSEQAEIEGGHISEVSKSDGILQDAEQLDLVEDSSEDVSGTASELINEDVGCQDGIEYSSDGNEDSSSEVRSVIKVVMRSPEVVANSSDNSQFSGKDSVKHDLKQESVKDHTGSTLEVASVEDCSVQSLAKQVVFLEDSKEDVHPGTSSRHLSSKFGPTGKVSDAGDVTADHRNPEASPEDWSQFVGTTKAPMPSPEEESWRYMSSSALPRAPDRKPFDISSSMLGFPDLKSSPDGGPPGGDAKNSPLTEVLFDPDTCAASMLGFSDEKGAKLLELSFTGPGFEDGEMSTSFSAPGEEEEEEEYAPDWESDSEGSSSSGEFIWRPYDCLPEFPMEAIAEEDEDEDDDDDDDDDEDSSVGSGTEFVPSAWDSQATPSRSALRSPDKKSDVKKNVWFKKQKYHCVYEYPRENSDTESEASETGFADGHPWRSNAVADQTNQLWESQVVSTPAKTQGSWQPAVVDYAAYADWEVTDGDGAEQDTDTESDNQISQLKAEPFDFYKLSSVDYDFSTGVMSEDGEFFISSSARPFQQMNVAPSSLFAHSSSQFFPGQSLEFPATGDIADPPPAIDSFGDEIDTSPQNIAAPKMSPLLLSELATERAASEEPTTDDQQKHSDDSSARTCVVNDKSVDVERAEIGISAIPPSLKTNVEGIEKTDSSEREFSDSSQTPPSPLSPTGLGELRHTRDKLKLNLPSTNGAFLLDLGGKWGRSSETEDLDANPAFLLDAPGKKGRTVLERGEASLLDSGEETEDSGIESSNGMSATMTMKTSLEENLNGALANAH